MCTVKTSAFTLSERDIHYQLLGTAGTYTDLTLNTVPLAGDRSVRTEEEGKSGGGGSNPDEMTGAQPRVLDGEVGRSGGFWIHSDSKASRQP